MSFISLNTASSITGLSKRTLWRRIAEGVLRTEGAAAPGERAHVAVADVLRFARLPLAPEDHELIERADSNNPEAQCELALLMLSEALAAEAVGWMEKAARQFYPEAMYWLARCHISGEGVPVDAAAGIAWLEKAASHGHVVARHLLDRLHAAKGPAAIELRDTVALDNTLDRLERELVLQALVDTANRTPG